MDDKTKQYVLKQLVQLPVPYKYIFFDEDTDTETLEIIGNIIYVEFFITPNECPHLTKNYITKVYFWIPDEFPFIPPTVMLEHPLIHEMTDFEEINMCSYSIFFTLSELMMNAYCIILEGLNNNENFELIEYINSH